MRKPMVQRVVYLALALSLVAGMTTQKNSLQNFESRKDEGAVIAQSEVLYDLAPRKMPYGYMIQWCPVNE